MDWDFQQTALSLRSIPAFVFTAHFATAGMERSERTALCNLLVDRKRGQIGLWATEGTEIHGNLLPCISVFSVAEKKKHFHAVLGIEIIDGWVVEQVYYNDGLGVVFVGGDPVSNTGIGGVAKRCVGILPSHFSTAVSQISSGLAY